MSGWQQPILTSNGAWGVDDFAVRGWSNDTYLAFDGTTKYLNGTNTGRYIEIWIKDGLALSDVVLASSDGYLTTRGIIAYSDDGETYTDCGTWLADNGEQTTVVCTNHDVHKYFRLTFKSFCDYKSGNADISNISLVDCETSSSTTPVALNFDGKTNYAKIPVSLTDISDWSAEITFETTENRSAFNIYHQHCLFGYDAPGYLSRDFHVDTKDGKLYIFVGLGGKTPIGGTSTNDNGNYGIDTGVTVNDGKRHTVKAVSTTGKLEVYCDNVLTTTIYPDKTLDANAFYIGCSKPGESVFCKLTLHSFTLAKNGKIVAEYEPTVKDAALKILTDESGNGNDATLYGNVYEYKTVDIYFDLLADTSRTVQATTAVDADTCRTVAAHLADFDFSADAARTVHRAEIVGADTGRTIQTTTTINADAARKTVLPFEIDADTQRRFGVSIPFSFGADTSCTVERTEKINADFVRRVEKTIAVNVDAMRDVVQAPFSFAVDTTRNLQQGFMLGVDTSRTVERIESVNGDSIRYLVFNIDKLLIPANQPPAQGEFTPFPANPPKTAKQGIISMTLELATGTLSDTLNLETFGTDFTPKRAIRGTFLDFPYEFRMEQVTTTGERQKITSMSYIDRLLYVPLKFYVEGGDEGDNFESLAKSLAKHLGYACETHMENIYLKTGYSGMTVTYSAVMSGAFGWLSDLPWRQVNVYIKGGTMYFVQRGQEPTVYDITNLHHDEPTIVQKVYRSRFSANNKTPDPEKVKPAKKGGIHTKGYTGRVQFPNGDYTEYLNGQPIESERSTESGTVFTRWEYNGNDKLVAQDSRMTPRKDDVNRTETHTRFYYYTPVIGGSQFMVTETRTSTTEYDRKTGKSTTTETVNYTENGKDSTTSTTIRDGDMVVSSGPVGINTGSEYALNQQNIVMTGGATKWFDDDGNEIKDEADISFASLPISEAPNSGVQLPTLVEEINSHDRCIEETVEMNIIEAVKDGVPSLTHVINFGERIKYNGNEYCLERNTVTRTTREIKQNIVMIKWFDLSEGVKQ
nr:MAG TPA: SEX HORMONE-BINDING GLOBULIN TRANSPORT, LAMININ G-LIKE DOMAIN [Caudoviricetes sp.]